MWRNSEQGYGLVSIVIHWLVALAVFGLFGLGLFMVDLTYYSPWYQTAPYIHKSVGLILFALMLFRVLWRFVNVSPASPSNHSKIEKIGAKIGHRLIYTLLFLLMISGYLISTADGRGISVFNWFEVPAWITSIDQQEDIAGEIHFWLAWTLIIMAAGHALAAIKHHVIDKDTTLTRILIPAKTNGKGESR